MPDLKNPQYAYYRAGMGSNKINMALTNSILTSYGLETDAKISETIKFGPGKSTKIKIRVLRKPSIYNEMKISCPK